MTVGLFLLRCKELHLTLEELERLKEGMIYDLMIERSNDDYEYPYKATQADFEAFRR